MCCKRGVMYAIQENLKLWEQRLLQANIENARQEVFFLCKELVGLDKVNLLTQDTFTKKQFKILERAVVRRSLHRPLQSIIGFSDFCGLKIIESRHTLTPRPETEVLVEKVAENGKGNKVLDLCAGSGCVGLALKSMGFHDVTLADISQRALSMARKNAKLNGLEVKYLRTDMFNNVTSTYDIIVSNPPYIPSVDIKSLTKEVKKFDPKRALDGGQDGLKFYRIIADIAPQFLTRQGKIYLEIGKGQEEDIVALLEENFENITVIKDYAGVNRIIKADLKC